MRRRALAIPALCLGLVLGVAAAPGEVPPDLRAFLERHWRLPLALQGAPPTSFGPLERSLHPEACAACHPLQYRDWNDSIHALSMGPGVSGQLREMRRTEPAQAQACYTCHAPLAEQRPGSSAHDPTLSPKGIACASCHVRNWRWFGPPRLDGTLSSTSPRDGVPHGGVTRTPAFLRAEFCRDCHQFPPGGLSLNGKLLQDTYEEWKAGPAAASLQCQDCHMPARRHLWRGIHDPEMVRSAIEFTLTDEPDAVTLTLRNRGAGHKLPTYVTPRLVVSGEALDEEGRAIPGSRREAVIGRAVTLDLSRELFDTRLAPGQGAVFRYPRAFPNAPRSLPSAAGRIRLRVVVEPDHFYVSFFAALLERGAGAGETEIRTALAAARASSFVVFEREVRAP